MAGRWAGRGVWGRTQGSDATQTGLAGVIAGLSILVGQREAEVGDAWVGILSFCRTGTGETGGGSEEGGMGRGRETLDGEPAWVTCGADARQGAVRAFTRRP